MPITEPVAGDGCCPGDGATDPDCKQECGTDGTTCTTLADAQRDTSQQCQAILAAKAGAQSDACNACACSDCSEEMLDCYESDDSKRDQRCIPIAVCSAASGCWGDSCYCGWSLGCVSPDGPCRQELEAAAVTPSAAAVEQCANDPACAAFRSSRYRECLRRRCYSECS